jgi:hypothetical protein
MREKISLEERARQEHIKQSPPSLPMSNKKETENKKKKTKKNLHKRNLNA